MALYTERLSAGKTATQNARQKMKPIVSKQVSSTTNQFFTEIKSVQKQDIIKKLANETLKNASLAEIEEIYSYVKSLHEVKELHDTAGLIYRARTLKSVFNHMDTATKDFFFSVGFDDAVFAAADTDLGRWVRDNSGQALKDLDLILSHVKNGTFWETLIEDAKTTDWEQMQKEHNQFGKDLAVMFVKSLGQGTENLAIGVTERIIGVSNFLVQKIVIPSLNTISGVK